MITEQLEANIFYYFIIYFDDPQTPSQLHWMVAFSNSIMPPEHGPICPIYLCSGKHHHPRERRTVFLLRMGRFTFLAAKQISPVSAMSLGTLRHVYLHLLLYFQGRYLVRYLTISTAGTHLLWSGEISQMPQQICPRHDRISGWPVWMVGSFFSVGTTDLQCSTSCTST